MIWLRFAGLVALLAGLILAAGTGPAAALPGLPAQWRVNPGDPGAEAILSLAVRSSRTVDYEGLQSVSVRDQRGTETEILHVARGDGDRLLAETQAGSAGWVLEQQGRLRASMDRQGGSATVGEAPLGADIEPDANVQQLLSKYRVILDGPAQFLSHPAWVLRLVRGDDALPVERWTVDAGSGLILDRESYDPDGQVERSIAFTSVEEPYTPPASDLEPPAKVAASPGRPQQWFAAGQLAGFARGLGLPAELPDHYQLRAGTRISTGAASVVQLVYSDGLEEVSLFQQPGTITKASIPPGAHKVTLAHESGYLWSGFPRGAAWQAGAEADTLVGDSPADELEHIANALPQAPMHRSIGMRLSQLARWIRERLSMGAALAPRARSAA